MNWLKNTRARLTTGCIIIGLISCFIWYFSYINEPIGDDVLLYFDGAIASYLDDYEFVLGDKLTSFTQVINELKFIYMHWSGRMPGYFLCLTGKYYLKSYRRFSQVLYLRSIFCWQ